MPRPRLDEEGPNPVDIHVGSKVKTRRLMLGLSQEELAKAIGLTFQQVQKYERGTNRISVSRLLDIGRALKVPYDYFIEGSGTPKKSTPSQPQEEFEPDPLTRRDVLELVRAYTSIRTPQLKKQLIEMAKAMAVSAKERA